MSYKSRRYQQGLSGQKPGWISFDKDGQRAQEAGYRAHLSNQDLAARIRGNDMEDYGDDSYRTPTAPLEPWQRVLWCFIGAGLAWVAWQIAMWATTTADHMERRDFNVPEFIFYLFVVPGGIFLWPALVSFGISLSKD